MGQIRLACILLMVVASGCATTLPPVGVVPFELENEWMIVPVMVNGVGPLDMIIDSGAEHSVISPKAAAASTIERGSAWHGQGFGAATQPITFLKGVSFQFSNVQLPMRWVNETPESMFALISSVSGRRVDGILGSDLFFRYVVEIDFQERLIRLHEPSTYRHRGRGTKLKLVAERGLRKVPVKIVAAKGDSPADCLLTLDTGAAADVVLCKPMLDRHPVHERIATRGVRGGGFGGVTMATTGPLAAVHLGPYELGGTYAKFQPDEARLGDGVLGQGILQMFDVVIDYSRYTLILEPRTTSKPRPRDQSGVVLLAEGPNLREYRVDYVFEDTPAARAGLKVGDLVVAIDGKPAGEATLSEVRKRFTKDDPCPLTIRRGGETIECVIVLRPLL